MTHQVKMLNDAQKELVKALQSPADLPVQERRAHYRAMDRFFEGPDVDPALLQKYQAASGSHRKKLLGHACVSVPWHAQ